MYHRACWRTRSGVGAGVGEEGSGGLGLDVAHDLEAAPVMVYGLELRWSRRGGSGVFPLLQCVGIGPDLMFFRVHGKLRFPCYL
jgi:hypothetical protein